MEGFLARYPRTVLLISHDRGLLNASVNGILHLSARKLAYYSGTFEQFDAERRARMAQEAALAKRQTAERERISEFCRSVSRQGDQGASGAVANQAA